MGIDRRVGPSGWPGAAPRLEAGGVEQAGQQALAATEVEDEQLWDGQARSSRYQNFSKSGFVTPPELESDADKALYVVTGNRLLDGYKKIHERMVEHLI